MPPPSPDCCSPPKPWLSRFRSLRLLREAAVTAAAWTACTEDSDQWSVNSKNLATDAGFGISRYDQLNDIKASSFGWGPFIGKLDCLRRDRRTSSRISLQPTCN